jgi:replication factor A2
MLIVQVLQIDHKQTNVTYHVTDGTGEMYVVLYVDSDLLANNEKLKNITEQSYIKVFGNLKFLNDQKKVMAFHIEQLTDYNEITFHSLDTILSHCKATKGNNNQQQVSNQLNNYSSANTNQFTNNNYNNQFSNSNNNNFMADSMANNGGNDLNAAVRAIFRENDSEQGASIQHVHEKLKKFSMVEIQKAVEFLSDEGHLYSTIDDMHYKCTVLD